MDMGWILGGAWRLLRRRQEWLLGIVIALLGVGLVGLDVSLRLGNRNYLTDALNSLGSSAPSNLGWYLLALGIVAFLGGLAAEGGLIAGAGRRVAASLPPLAPVAAPSTPERRGLALWLRLIGVAWWVWWPVIDVVAFLFGLLLGVAGMDASGEGVYGVLVLCFGCAGIVLLLAWWLLWPVQRLANCAVVLDGLPARQAAREARALVRAHPGAVLGLWLVLSLLNLLLLAVSAALAGGGALLVWGVFQGTGTLSPAASLDIAGAVAVVIGLILLLWDGALTAFNLNAWVLAYCRLRSRVTTAIPLPGGPDAGGQMLGRLRLPPVDS
jgi:hypothetical protein